MHAARCRRPLLGPAAPARALARQCRRRARAARPACRPARVPAAPRAARPSLAYTRLPARRAAAQPAPGARRLLLRHELVALVAAAGPRLAARRAPLARPRSLCGPPTHRHGAASLEKPLPRAEQYGAYAEIRRSFWFFFLFPLLDSRARAALLCAATLAADSCCGLFLRTLPGTAGSASPTTLASLGLGAVVRGKSHSMRPSRPTSAVAHRPGTTRPSSCPPT
jgi:hypothetical protein